MITPIAWRRVRRDAETNPTTMTVVAEEDCTTEVAMNPENTPANRLAVIIPTTRLSRLPVACCKPSLMSRIP